jgi:hypothetical protein
MVDFITTDMSFYNHSIGYLLVFYYTMTSTSTTIMLQSGRLDMTYNILEIKLYI